MVILYVVFYRLSDIHIYAISFVDRTDATGAGVLSGVRRQVVRETLRRVLLRRLFVFFQTERQTEDRVHVHWYVPG